MGRPKGSKNKRKPGRPKGSKNKSKTSSANVCSPAVVAAVTRAVVKAVAATPAKRGPGRPKGSKNKKPTAAKTKSGKPRGRPKGSKNKPKVTKAEVTAITKAVVSNLNRRRKARRKYGSGL